MKVSVIESRWNKDKNWSVKSIYDILSDLHYGHTHNCHYETANTKDSLEIAIRLTGQFKDVRILSINCHGKDDGLYLLDETKITKAALRNLLLRQGENFSFEGIHFGACEFLNEEKAQYFYEKEILVPWMSGYSKEVDWIDSTAFDFIFFNRLFAYYSQVNENRLFNDIDEQYEAIYSVAEDLNRDCKTLMKRLGFAIYVNIPAGKESYTKLCPAR